MNQFFSDILHAASTPRRAGHTHAAAQGVKAGGKEAVLICATQQHADQAAKEHGIRAVGLENLRALMGLHGPHVFDHYAVAFMCRQVDDVIRNALQRASDLANAAIARVDLAEKVKAFHLKFNHPVRTKPAVPSDEELQFRLKLIKEEFFELFRAAYREGPLDNFNAGFQRIRDAEYQLDNLLSEEAEIRCGVDFPEFVDAIADLKYVLEGTNLVCGVDGDAVMEEVQRANMSKEATHVANKDAFHRGGVKPTKPPGWAPPDIAGVLVAQGWDKAGE